MENDEARLAIEAGALAAEPSNTREAPLRLGCTRTIADYTAPRLMAEHLSTHPQAEVTLLTGNTRELVHTREAPLRLGCTRTIADYTAPRLMAEHLSTHPQAEVTLLTGNTRELVRSLDEGTIDFALVEGFFDRQRFDFETLSRERYIAVASPKEAKRRAFDRRPRADEAWCARSTRERSTSPW